MATSIKVVHQCDHIVESYEKVNSRVPVERGSGEYDIIVMDAKVLRVFSVYSIKSGVRVPYLLDRDYKVLDNKIKWLNNAPEVGERYYAQVYYVKLSVVEYEPQGCPRCLSDGWYVDLFDESELKGEEATGTYKVVQEFLKGLFTRLQIDGYGTNIHDFISVNIYNPAQVIAEITNIINSAERRLKKSQVEALSGGVDYSDDELLETVEISDMRYVKDAYSLFVELTLVTRSGQATRLGIEV